MITIQNYYTEFKTIDQTTLPATLVKSGQFVDKITKNGSTWETYHASDQIKKTVDIYLTKLNDFLKVKPKNETPQTKTNKGVSKTKSFSSDKAEALYSQFVFTIAGAFDKKWFIHKGQLLKVKKEIFKLAEDQSIFTQLDFKEFVTKSWELQKDMVRLKTEISTSTRQDWLEFTEEFEELLEDAEKLLPKSKVIAIEKPTKKKKKTARELAYDNAHKVEKIGDDLKIIKRFVLMHDKFKSQKQIRLIINALQKAIIEKRIRKTSESSKEIIEIQSFLIKLHGKFDNESHRIHVIIGDKKRSHYLTLVGKQTELYSVKLIKSYVNLQGKLITNLKAKRLYNRIANAVNKGKLSKKDKYWEAIDSIISTLRSFVKKNTVEGELMIPSKELNGLEGIINGCPCTELNGIPRNTIMSSTDVVNLDFEKLGFTGKWRELIGNPSSGFTTMIFGKPKMGKSYLAVDFSGYLARNHGTVLYVAREEGIDDTMQQKLKDKNVAHPDLYVSDYLPEDLSDYDFVFFDSVNKLGLKPHDLDELKRRFPTTSFIYIFQTTKQGNFKGGNEFQHDVDVVIEVPEKGKAVQFGRFNQGGEINIFSQSVDNHIN